MDQKNLRIWTLLKECEWMNELMILNCFKSDCSAKDLALIRAQDLPRAKFMKGTGIKNKSKET